MLFSWAITTQTLVSISSLPSASLIPLGPFCLKHSVIMPLPTLKAYMVLIFQKDGLHLLSIESIGACTLCLPLLSLSPIVAYSMATPLSILICSAPSTPNILNFPNVVWLLFCFHGISFLNLF